MGRVALGLLLSLLMAGGSVLPTVTHAATASNATQKANAKKVAAAKRKAASRNVAKTSREGDSRVIKRTVVVDGKRKVVYQQRTVARPATPAAPPVLTAGDLAGLRHTRDPLDLHSNVALVLDQSNFEVLFEKNSNVPLPIASITKVMTGLIVVEAHQDMDEVLQITEDDIDREKNTSSRLAIGTQLTRGHLLHLALMSSENRAASALGRNYPGGLRAFVAAMNAKARSLGMHDTHYVDSSGLSSRNVASARDLAKLVVAAQQHPILGYYSTAPESVVESNGRALHYKNTNHLVYNSAWEIGLQKTGYISEAGRCLVMQTRIEGRPIVMVFLDSKGKQSRLADASRIRKWLENVRMNNMSTTQSLPGAG